jgi:hypothetical protein
MNDGGKAEGYKKILLEGGLERYNQRWIRAKSMKRCFLLTQRRSRRVNRINNGMKSIRRR